MVKVLFQKPIGAILLLLVNSFLLASCGKQDVDKVVDAVNSAAEALDKASNNESLYIEIEQQLEDELNKYRNSTYALTRADKQALAEAWTNLEMVVDNEPPSREQEILQRYGNDIAQYKTLGELLSKY